MDIKMDSTVKDPVIEESLKREASLTDPEQIEDERIFRHLHKNGYLNQSGPRFTIEDLERDHERLLAQGK